MLVLALGLGMTALGENAAPAANNLVIKVVTDEKTVPQFYTPLTLNGLNHIVYAYNDTKGNTQFRVYGELNGALGFYPVNIAIAGQNTGVQGVEPTYTISVEANLQQIVDDPLTAGVAKAAAQGPSVVPQGYQKWGTQANLYYFTNTFGEWEYRLYGTFDDVNAAFYPALGETGTAVPGALAVETTNDQLFMPQGAQYADKPATMAQGWQRQVLIALNGTSHGVKTALPEFTTVQNVPQPTPQIIYATPAPGSTTQKPSSGSGAGGNTLSQGSKGEQVLLLTRRLVILGYMNNATRTYDKNVASAVKRFQRDYGLIADGMAGDSTLKKINGLVPSTSYLSLNHSGSRVTELTRKLVKLGYLSQENNYFDKTVEQAVRSFQRDYGLSIDGIVGPNTERKLNNAASGITPSDPYWALYSSRLLKKGNSGEAVYQLSQRLVELGFLIYTNRTFDQTMADGVQSFQLSQGLKGDGIVGAQTLKALKNPQKPLPSTPQPFPTGRPSPLPPGVTPTQLEPVVTSPGPTVVDSNNPNTEPAKETEKPATTEQSTQTGETDTGNQTNPNNENNQSNEGNQTP